MSCHLHECIARPIWEQLGSLSMKTEGGGGSLLVPEIIDPVFAKTSPNPSVSMTEYERFGLVFTKTRVYKFGHRNGKTSLVHYRTLSFFAFSYFLNENSLFFAFSSTKSLSQLFASLS